VSREQSTFVPSSETRSTCADVAAPPLPNDPFKYCADAPKGHHRPFRTSSTAYLVCAEQRLPTPTTISPSVLMPWT
jgi:hypothetical protein